MGAAYHLGAWIALAGVPALLTIDALMGLAYRTNTISDVKVISSRSGKTHRAVVIFPGYVMSGSTVGQAFAPYVADNDGIVVVNYAQRGVNVPQIYGKVMSALQTLRPVEVRIYGASMGGMVSKLFLDRYRQDHAPYGKVTLILDSVPAGKAYVKRPAFLFQLGCLFRGGPLTSALWAAADGFVAKPPAGKDASPDIIRAARRAGAWVGTPAATSQACFISKFGLLREDELVDVVQKTVYLQGNPPDDDPLVRISDSIAEWRFACRNLMVVTVPGRTGRWHLPLVEFPRETARAITAVGY